MGAVTSKMEGLASTRRRKSVKMAEMDVLVAMVRTTMRVDDD